MTSAKINEDASINYVRFKQFKLNLWNKNQSNLPTNLFDKLFIMLCTTHVLRVATYLSILQIVLPIFFLRIIVTSAYLDTWFFLNANVKIFTMLNAYTIDSDLKLQFPWILRLRVIISCCDLAFRSVIFILISGSREKDWANIEELRMCEEITCSSLAVRGTEDGPRALVVKTAG